MATPMATPVQDLNDYSGASLVPTGIALACLSTAAVILRFVSRKITKVQLLWDDWLILAALPFSLLECAIDVEGNFLNHFGRHIETGTPDQIRQFFITTYIFQLAYGFAVTLPKFSMLALYRRVFGLENFRWPLLITFGTCVAYLIGITFSAIFVCIPVYGFWDHSVEAKCIPLLPFYIGQAAVNITLDLILLAVPIIPIRRLNITSSQKIAVSGIFFLGIFVTVCSVVRLHALVITTSAPAAAQDPTFNFVGPAVWSIVETNLSVVCACLPSMRPLLRVIIHGTFRSSAGHSEYSSQLESNHRASALIRTTSNRRIPERPAAPKRTWSERVAAVQRPAIPPRTFSARSATPAERASRWSRANAPTRTAANAKVEKYPLTPLPPGKNRTPLTAWRPNCPRAARAIDAIAGPSLARTSPGANDAHDRSSSHASWRPLRPAARPNSKAPALEDVEFPQRRDSVTVQSHAAGHVARGGKDAGGVAGQIGYRYEISGGQEGRRWWETPDESDSEGTEWKDVERGERRPSEGLGEWERAKRKGRARLVWEDWSRRPSRGE